MESGLEDVWEARRPQEPERRACGCREIYDHCIGIWVVVKIMVPFWGTLNVRCRIILGIRKGTIILTTTHIGTV